VVGLKGIPKMYRHGISFISILVLLTTNCFSQHGRHAAFQGRNERPVEVPDSPWEVYIGWFDSTNAFHITDSASSVDTLTGWMHNVRSNGKFLFWNSMNRSHDRKRIVLGYGYMPIDDGKLVPQKKVGYTIHRRLDPHAGVSVEFAEYGLEIATRFGLYHITELRIPEYVCTKKSLDNAMRIFVRAAKGYPKSIREDFTKDLFENI
jgi:hypothetical protein